MRLFIIPVIFYLVPGFLLSQSNTVSIGGDYSDKGYKLSYSVGQITYQTVGNTEFVLSEGVQQPVRVVSQNNINIEGNNAPVLYPNPTSSTLNMEVDKPLSYLMKNSTGEAVLNGTIRGQTTSIRLTSLKQGVYFLELYDVKHPEKPKFHYKIIKNQR